MIRERVRRGLPHTMSRIACFILALCSPSITLAQTQQGPPAPGRSQSAPSTGVSQGGTTVEDLLLEKGSITMDEWIRIKAEEEYRVAERDRAINVLEEWKAKIESLPVLNDKINVGMNALQWLYTHQDAEAAPGKSQNSISIRRSELIFWGRISDYIPRWHALYEFQSIGLTNATPDCSGSPGGNCANKPAGTAASSTFFRESYIDFRPILALAPNLNFFRLGIFRMPFGIFTETSGGLRDVISSPYLTSVGSGRDTFHNSTGGAIEVIQERDFFADARGRIADMVEYAAGWMDNINYQANAVGPNSTGAFYSRVRLFATDVSWISFTIMDGRSNNTNTAINGRGDGIFDRYGLDFRYMSKIVPGLMVQGEYWQGHDASNQTVTGQPAQGGCLNTAICGGTGAPGVQRRTYYVLAKYLLTDGWLENIEPTVMWEQFDPNTRISNDLYTRTILGLTYYLENLPPKIQSKVQFNYEFRHHSGFGPGTSVPSTDSFAQNVWLIQWQI